MIPVIMSGGSGTRLWPISRSNSPKQFSDVFEMSLFEKTISRLKPLGNPRVLTVAGLEVPTRKICTQNGIENENIYYEPKAKNTAPAIAYLCLRLLRSGFQTEVVGVFPSDHYISDEISFLSAIVCAKEIAATGQVVTLGIQPTFPATGYGYIEIDKKVDVTDTEFQAYSVESFHEKPNQQLAEKFISENRFFWNAGMFVFRLDVMVKHFQKLTPTLWSEISKIGDKLENLEEVFENLKSESFDYAIMEKLESQFCIPCDIGWSDVGSWDQLSILSNEVGGAKMASQADLVSIDSDKNFVFSSEKKTVALVGCDDLIVVDTPDALLISKKGETQKVKDVVDKIKTEGLETWRQQITELRPWGEFEVLSDQKQFRAKMITISPSAQLSYQSHELRAEHWIVISGEAEVTLNDQTHNLKVGQHIFIPKRSKHRIKNLNKNQPLLIVEVQVGSYFGEDDIVRYHDDYGRAGQPVTQPPPTF